MKMGDKFIFNKELMEKHNISMDNVDDKVHEVCSVEVNDGLGEIVGWWGSNTIPAQCNSVWLIRVDAVLRSGDEVKVEPPCPKCGTKGVFVEQTFDMVDGFFAIVDVYKCPVCDNDHSTIATHDLL